VTGPTVRRRKLGTELRVLREGSGLKLAAVASALGLSETTLSRIETGKASTRPVYLNAFLDLYQVTNQAHRDALLKLAREGSQRGWWTNYDDVMTTGMDVYIGLETDAVELRAWEPMLISGLVQTEAYSEAVLRQLYPRVPQTYIDRLVRLRMLRQELLRTPEHPFDLWLIQDEASLCRPVGGRTVMAGQLDQLLMMAEHPGVNVQVLPFSAGAHAGLRGAFSILAFLPGQDGAVSVESPAGILFLEKPAQVDETRRAFEHLSASALAVAASRDRIARARHELERLPRSAFDLTSEESGNHQDNGGKTVEQTDSLTWFKSSASSSGACVEVAHVPGGGVALRDTKDRAKPAHFYTREEWAAFLAGAKNGEFDLLAD
jgi:hypothetical protein